MQVPQDVNLQRQLTELRVRQWQQGELLSPRWWSLIAILAVCVVLWWILVRKRRLLEIGLYVFLAAVLFMGINEYGEELTLWDYPTDIIAYFPPLSSVCMFILPLGFSIIYQHYESLKGFMAASLVYTAAVSFVVQPLLAAAGLFRLVHWQYYESLPVFFLAGVAVRAAVRSVLRQAEKHHAS